jgi:2-polyprenyl-6-methoxyphenol hydroxylase-like FAD-dependent oxidoreductase
VIGAGIGGLATAIALQPVIGDVTVLERAPTLLEIGTGIALWPNAMRALRQLGVGDGLELASIPADGFGLRTWNGASLGPPLFEQLQARFGAPLLIVHRGRLQAALRAALAPGTLQLDAECVAVEQEEHLAAVHLSSREVERGDVVIGADGLHSCVRAALFGDGRPPHYSGFTAWRGVVPHDQTLGSRISDGESLGHGSLFGMARLGGRQAYWWASTRCPAAEGASPELEKAALLGSFSTWHDPIPELVAATPAVAIVRTRLYERPPLPQLAVGRIALVGDAAHPMLPNLGHGAGHAIEDAVALAGELARSSDTRAALEAYSVRRARRSAQVVRASARVARAAHLRNPVAVSLRNTALRAVQPSLSLGQLTRPDVEDPLPN